MIEWYWVDIFRMYWCSLWIWKLYFLSVISQPCGEDVRKAAQKHRRCLRTADTDSRAMTTQLVKQLEQSWPGSKTHPWKLHKWMVCIPGINHPNDRIIIGCPRLLIVLNISPTSRKMSGHAVSFAGTHEVSGSHFILFTCVYIYIVPYAYTTTVYYKHICTYAHIRHTLSIL